MLSYAKAVFCEKTTHSSNHLRFCERGRDITLSLKSGLNAKLRRIVRGWRRWCRAGWIVFKVELPSLATSLEVIDLRALLRKRPPELACLGTDIPIGLLGGPRACDKEARRRLGQPRGT